MPGRPWAREEGIQPALFGDESGAEVVAARWRDELELRREIELLRARVPANADAHAAHLAAMVHQSPHGTAARFAADWGAVITALRAPLTRAQRQRRHHAIQEFLSRCPELIGRDAAERTRAEIARAFPGRRSPREQFVDRDLGGSEKAVRVRSSLTWADGAVAIAAAAAIASPGADRRDRLITALSVRSGVPPFRLPSLDWRELRPLLHAEGEVARAPIETKRGRLAIAFHRDALDALAAHRQFEGHPQEGPVLRGLRAPRDPLTGRHIGEVLRRVTRRAGLPALDRRHLRAPFGWWLQQHLGWSDLEVRDALGLSQVRDLERLLLPLREAAAQQAASEFVMLPGSSMHPDTGETMPLSEPAAVISTIDPVR